MCFQLEQSLAAGPSRVGAPSVFLVDDEPRVRDGLRNLLCSRGCSISGEANGGEEALAHAGLAGSSLVLLDLALGRESGFDLIAPLRARGLPVLVCSLHEGAHVIRRALAAGACGYVAKREAAGHLMQGIETILACTPYLSPRPAAALDVISQG